MSNEQIEFLRNEINRLDGTKHLKTLMASHMPKLEVLCEKIAAARPSESRTRHLLDQIADLKSKSHHPMELVDLVSRIRHLTNQNVVRRLIDSYEGGWNEGVH